MNKATLTAAGARRVGRLDLNGQEIDYDGVAKPRGDNSVVCANEMYHNGKYIGASLAFTGDRPGLIDQVEAWKHL